MPTAPSSLRPVTTQLQLQQERAADVARQIHDILDHAGRHGPTGARLAELESAARASRPLAVPAMARASRFIAEAAAAVREGDADRALGLLRVALDHVHDFAGRARAPGA